MSGFQYLARRSMAPAAAYLVSTSLPERCSISSCKADVRVMEPENTKVFKNRMPPSPKSMNLPAKKAGMMAGDILNNEETFHGLFPLRQLWRPRVEYPLWDYDWDERMEKPTGDLEKDKQRERFVRKSGVTRHIILIRHGQYEEYFKEDEKRLLTPLGREQADLTGKRLAEMVQGVNKQFGPCNVKVLRVSDMARAKETADIIAKHLPGVERAPPDSLLNEGRPSHHIPGGTASPAILSNIDENHPRIEAAFGKYFYRANPPEEQHTVEDEIPIASEKPETGEQKNKGRGIGKLNLEPAHEFEIIVCHANVIRYFLCRALQLPPEAWLRLCVFNCSLTYFTIRPTGTVSCRMLGDIGHLDYGRSSFSMHHGFNW